MIILFILLTNFINKILFPVVFHDQKIKVITIGQSEPCFGKEIYGNAYFNKPPLLNLILPALDLLKYYAAARNVLLNITEIIVSSIKWIDHMIIQDLVAVTF